MYICIYIYINAYMINLCLCVYAVLWQLLVTLGKRTDIAPSLAARRIRVRTRGKVVDQRQQTYVSDSFYRYRSVILMYVNVDK